MILVLTAGFGDGHNTAARSTAQALERRCPDEEIMVSDLICETHPRTGAVLKALYQFAITVWPASWRTVYQWLEKSKIGPVAPAWQILMLESLVALIEQKKPQLIVSTYPLYAELVMRLRSRMKVPPLVTVITDSISVHPIWLIAPSDLICVADEETRGVVERMGGERERVRVTGFPVSLAFMDSAKRTDKGQRLLYLPSTSARCFARTLEALRPMLQAGLHLTLPVGKHASRLHHHLRQFLDSMPEADIEVIGWTNRMPELLQTHDALISKAGGAILHEVLAARCPVVIDYVVPGQEEGNAEILLAAGCAIRSHSPAETAAGVARLLAENGRLGHEFREKMIPLSVPDAALRVADEALKLAASVNNPPFSHAI